MANEEGSNLLDLEVQTVSDEEFLASCATQNKISIDVMEKLRVEGFTSMDALKLIDRDDLCKAKLAITRGQQKLVLAAVQKFIQTQAPVQASAQPIATQPGGSGTQAAANNQSDDTGNTDVAQTTSAPIAPANGMNETRQTSVTVLSGSDKLSTSGSQIHTVNEDPNVRALLQQFRAGQGQSNGTNVVIIPGTSEPANNQVLNGLGIGHKPQSMTNRPEPTRSAVGPGVSDSWRDPQIYLQAVASDKSSHSFYYRFCNW